MADEKTGAPARALAAVAARPALALGAIAVLFVALIAVIVMYRGVGPLKPLARSAPAPSDEEIETLVADISST